MKKPQEKLTVAAVRQAHAQSAAEYWGQAEIFGGQAVVELRAAVKGATQPQYDAVARIFKDAYMAANGVKEAAADMAFSRLTKAAEVSRPKATTKAAKKKAAQREAAKNALADIADEDIADEIKAAKKADDQKRAKALERENARRLKATAAEAAKAERRVRDDIAATLKGFNLEELHKVQGFIATVRSLPGTAKPGAAKAPRTLRKVA